MASKSPESEPSDVGSIECFQNYTAGEVFIQGIGGQVNQHDVETIISAQKHMLQRFEKSNEMLTNCNTLSAARLHNASKDFKKHTHMLIEMKKDLDSVFRRIRNLKGKLAQQYPGAMEELSKNEGEPLCGAASTSDDSPFDSGDNPKSEECNTESTAKIKSSSSSDSTNSLETSPSSSDTG